MRFRLLSLVSFLFLIISTPAYPAAYVVLKKAGPYEVEVRLDRYHPGLGKNGIDIGIRGPKGEAVKDAEVLINYFMPPMPRMAPMNYRTKAPFRSGRYRADMNVIMTGPWVIAVVIRCGGQVITTRINVDAQ